MVDIAQPPQCCRLHRAGTRDTLTRAKGPGLTIFLLGGVLLATLAVALLSRPLRRPPDEPQAGAAMSPLESSTT